MNAHTRFEEAEGILRCVYSGPFKAAPMLKVAEATLERARAGGWTRVLVDCTASPGSSLSILGRFRLGVQISGIWDRGIRVAGVTRRDQTLTDFFFARVLRNRSVPIRVFFDRAEAEGRLRSDVPL